MNWEKKYSELYHEYMNLSNKYKELKTHWDDLVEDKNILNEKYQMCREYIESTKRNRVFSKNEYSSIDFTKLSKPSPKTNPSSYKFSKKHSPKISPPKKSPPHLSKNSPTPKSILKKSSKKSNKKIKFEDY